MEQGYTKDQLALLKTSLTANNNIPKSFLNIVTPYATTERKGPKLGNLGSQANRLLGTFTRQLISELQLAWEKLSDTEKTDERFLALAQPALLWLYCVFNISLEQTKMEKFKNGAFLGVHIYAAANALLDPLSGELTNLNKARGTKDPDKKPDWTQRKKLLETFQSALAPFINTQSRDQLPTLKSLYFSLIANEDETFRTQLIEALRLYAKLCIQTEPHQDTETAFSKAIDACNKKEADLLKQLRTVEQKLPTLTDIGRKLNGFVSVVEPYSTSEKGKIKQTNLRLAKRLVKLANENGNDDAGVLCNLRAWSLILDGFLDDSNASKFESSKFLPIFLRGIAAAFDCIPKEKLKECAVFLKTKIDAVLNANGITAQMQSVLKPLAVALINPKNEEIHPILRTVFISVLHALRTKGENLGELQKYYSKHKKIIDQCCPDLSQLHIECEAVGNVFLGKITDKKASGVGGPQSMYRPAKTYKAAEKHSNTAQSTEEKKKVDAELESMIADLMAVAEEKKPTTTVQKPAVVSVVTKQKPAPKVQDSSDDVEESSESSSEVVATQSNTNATQPAAVKATLPVASPHVQQQESDESQHSNEAEYSDESENSDEHGEDESSSHEPADRNHRDLEELQKQVQEVLTDPNSITRDELEKLIKSVQAAKSNPAKDETQSRSPSPIRK